MLRYRSNEKFSLTRKPVSHICESVPELKIPTRDRAFSFDRSAVDEEKRQVAFIFATETPCREYDYELGDHFEILDCSPGAVDLSRLLSGGPLLSEHDRNAQIGVHREAAMVVDPQKGPVGKAIAEFGNSAKAQEEWADVRQGIRTKFSVRYQPIEMVLESTSEARGDTYRITRWMALENSLVSMPADNACETSRAEPTAETTKVSILNPHNLVPMKVRNRSLFFKANDGSEGAGTPAEISPEQLRAIQEKATKDANADLQKRQREINDVVLTVRKREKKDFSDLAQRMVMEGKGVDDFCRALVTSEEYKPHSEEHVGSNVEVVGERAADPRNAARSWGDAFIESAGFRSFATGKGDAKFSVDLPRVRTTSTSTGLTSIDKQSPIPEIGTRRLTVKDLLAPGTTTGTTIRYIRETSFTNAATVVAEGAAKPEASFAFSEVDAPVRKIAAWTKMSEELAADYPAVSSFINQRLPYMVDLTEEDEYLNGDGTGQHLTGLLNTSGLLTQALAADTRPDAILKAITRVRFGTGLATGGWEPDGIVLNPTDWQTLRLMKDANNQYLAGGPFTGAYGNGPVPQVEMLWGKPVVVTPAIAAGTALVGNFRLGAQYFQREGMTIRSTGFDQDDFIKNLMTILAEIRTSLAVYRPAAFCKVTGL